MSLTERIDALKERHHVLESRLEAEENRPHPDDVVLHDLKKQKLRIKDELLSMGAS